MSGDLAKLRAPALDPIPTAAAVLLDQDALVAAEKERVRLEALARYDIVDTPPEEAFDRITRLLRRMFNVPIAIVSFIDAHRQWYKSCLGMDVGEIPRDQTICQYLIDEGRLLVVPDTRLDPRFANLPSVVGDPGVRFYAGLPLKNADGQVIGSLCVIDYQARTFDQAQVDALTEFAEIAMDELELRLTSTTDALTALTSRRAFREQAERAVALALRHRQPLSLVSLDIDRFKSINDTHGHAGGDRVLVAVARRLAGALRQSDIAGRLGGEEFAVVLPKTDRATAMKVAEKLRSEIANHAVDIGGESIPVTASFGITALAASGDSFDQILERADKAVYAAKAAGRNRCMASPTAEAAAPRRRVLKAGRIVFNGRASVIECTVRSLSDEGAGLDLSSSVGVPRHFDLLIPGDDFERACVVSEQAEKHLEVTFA
jgi:diguanylate cyclase (GGDEF)-like protein